MLERFRVKWTHHQNARLTGGVCDMTGLHAFARGRPNYIANLLTPTIYGVVDNNINFGGNIRHNEFHTQFGIKQVRFREGLPFFVEQRSGDMVPALVIHFQANAKRLMRGYASNYQQMLPILVTGWRLALTARAGLRTLWGLCHAE